MRRLILAIIASIALVGCANADSPMDDNAPGYNTININAKEAPHAGRVANTRRSVRPAGNNSARIVVAHKQRAVRVVPKPTPKPVRNSGVEVSAGYKHPQTPVNIDAPAEKAQGWREWMWCLIDIGDC